MTKDSETLSAMLGVARAGFDRLRRDAVYGCTPIDVARAEAALRALDESLAGIATERARWLAVIRHAAEELAELDDETAQVQSAALLALCRQSIT